MKRQRRYLIMGIVALVLVVGVALTGGRSTGPEQTLALQVPQFVVAAETAAAPPEVTAYLSSEAGISAYLQTSGAIDLNLVRGQYRTIEADTHDYIIGSVSVPTYPEEYDVHVYVHKDGWLLAYYLATDPASKIAHVKGSTISTTNLETVLATVAGAGGYSTADVRFYDFRYPNATHMLLVAEDHLDGVDFTIELPTEFGYSERSFATTATIQRDTRFYIDGVEATRSYNEFNLAYGWISASQLIPGESHQIQLDTYYSLYGVLVIIYRVP